MGANETPVRIAFGDTQVAVTFRADQEKRTISGLAVPWGKVARSGFSKWRFAQDSLHWSDESRIKLNLNHDPEHAIGRAVRIQNSPPGLDVTFKIARGDEGDRALSLAEDGVLDGFSVEVDFLEDDEWQPDPADETVRLVQRASLRGVALTAMPAFDDARASSIHATREGIPVAMPPELKTAPVVTDDEDEPNPIAELRTFMSQTVEKLGEQSDANFEKLGDTISAGFMSALEHLDAPQSGGREPVRAARFRFTNDPPVYTFDGNGQGHSLVRDAYYAAFQHDQDASDRLMRFRRQVEAVGAQFAATTGNASQIIPPGYRPDLYVSQLVQGRPFVDACSRGALDNATPFVVPTFASATGLSATHVETVNPTEGAITFGTKTVTPQAISGRITVSREMIDASNPAIDAIIMAAMRESYARQTESIVYTMLNGATGQGGTITAGLVPSGAQVATTTGQGDELLAGIRGALAVYPFRRFSGANQMLMSQEATTALATARAGTEGAFLMPSGPAGSIGEGNAAQNSWAVDARSIVPAWAATGNAAGDADVFMLNSQDAWVWESNLLTFRYEEKLGPAMIEFALFGYFATHLLRPVGLAAIRHTAS